MIRRTLCLMAGLMFLHGCVKAPQTAQQTISGMEPAAVLIAAQHGLALDGLDVEDVDYDAGRITTAWKTRGQSQVQYEVQVTPRADKSVSTVIVTIGAKARRRVGGAWGEPEPVTSADLKNLLESMVEQVVVEYAPGTIATTAPKMPSCTSGADCAAGTHCASGMCVAECSSASDCGAGYLCDGSGRCALEPPPPCPPPVEAPVETEDDDKKPRTRSREGKGGES